MREVMTRSAGHRATADVSLASCTSVSSVRPVQILDHQQAWPCPARPLDQPRHRPLPAQIARSVVHGIVEGAQLDRLRQVEQVVEKDCVIGRHQIRGQRAFARRVGCLHVAREREAEDDPHERADGVASGAGAEVEDQPGVAGEAGLAAASRNSSTRRVLPMPASPRR